MMRPRCGFCLAESGSRMPPDVFSSASSGSTTSRSSKGRIRTLPLFSFAIVFSVQAFLFLIPDPQSPVPDLHHPHAAHATHAHATHTTHAAAHSAHATH